MKKGSLLNKIFAVISTITIIFGLGNPYAVLAQDSEPGTGERISYNHPLETSGDEVTLDINLDRFTTKNGLVKVVIELSATPTVEHYSETQSQGEAEAQSAAIAQLAKIKREQNATVAKLTSSEIAANVIYTTQRVYNGIAVQVDKSKLKTIQKLPGVKAIHPLISKTIDNSYSVPLIGAPTLWQLSSSTTGSGIKVGVIDTGIDYLHANFGGPGTVTAYDDNDSTVIESSSFPTVKVMGGYDFAGDDYDANGDDGSPTPAPDPDPLDCNGHGSHVAGSIGGFGVNTDGSTFTGDYADVGFNPTALKIGPGVAPDVELYALKVFGCEGSTDVTDQAIEWAVDPNGDGDFSDHLDVINMSLGSPYGTEEDSSAIAANNAALAGVLVVASSGNENDITYITGSPATATRAISVAASVDPGEVMDGFAVNSPALLAGIKPTSNAAAYDWANDPPVTGDLLYPATNRSGCSAFSAGTFTGKIALLDWNHNPDGSIGCGSVTRTSNAVAAGAIGVLIAYDLDILDTAITGSAVVPSTITTKQVGDAIKDAISDGDTVNVTITGAFAASVVNNYQPMTDMVASFSSRGPRRGDSFLKPDITAPGMTIFSTLVGSGNGGQSMNGTSMSAPHVAGVMALLKQMHPTWSVEELKALVMNSADRDLYAELSQSGAKYAPSRVGAGRVELTQALVTDILMYNADDEGAISVSFGAPEISAITSISKNVKLVNKTNAATTVVLEYLPMTDIPGVEYKIVAPGSTTPAPDARSDAYQVVVPANGSYDFEIQFTANPALMKHIFDPALSGSTELRSWMAEESGYLYANYNSTSSRLPIYSAPRPASTMAAANTPVLDAVVQQGASAVDLDGTGVLSWSQGGYSTDEDITSLVTALQLAGASEEQTDLEFGKSADLQYVGVMTDWNTTSGMGVYFGISTYKPWNSPNEVEFDIYIDVDQDGTDDYILFNYNLGSAQGSDATDEFITVLYNLNTSHLTLQEYINGVPTYVDTALFNNSVMVMPVYITTGASSSIISDPNLKFDYYVASFSTDAGSGSVDVSDVYTYDFSKMGIDTVAGKEGSPIWVDLPGKTIDFTYNLRDGVDAGQMLLLHHQNTTGTRAEVVDIIDESIHFPLISK